MDPFPFPFPVPLSFDDAVMEVLELLDEAGCGSEMHRKGERAQAATLPKCEQGTSQSSAFSTAGLTCLLLVPPKLARDESRGLFFVTEIHCGGTTGRKIRTSPNDNSPWIKIINDVENSFYKTNLLRSYYFLYPSGGANKPEDIRGKEEEAFSDSGELA